MTSTPAVAPDPLQQRTLRVLLFAQVLSGAGLAAGVTVGALLAEEMLGSADYAGVATALFTIGSAGAAALVGRRSQAAGRRAGLWAGYAVGAVGGALVVAAAALDSIALLLLALVLYGAGVATNLQARYAGADLAEPSHRGRAVSTVLVATTVGGVIGPNTVGLTGDLATGLGLTPLAGPFMLATVAYTLAAATLWALLRPDPLLVARERAATAALANVGAATTTGANSDPVATSTAPASTERQPASAPIPTGRSEGDASALRLAAAAMIVTQLVMVGVMTMTPVHMREHGHSLQATGFVIAVHVAAMFLPSPITGRLVDRYGRRPLIAAGGLTLAAAGIVSAAAPPDSMVLLTIGLGLLGLGWNLGLVGGTALLTDATTLDERARVQGTVDLGVSVAGAAAGLGSGFMVASTSYAALSLLGGTIALALIPFLRAGAGGGVAQPARA